MPIKRLATALLAQTLGATACTGDDNTDRGEPTTPVTNIDGDEIVLTTALVTLGSCDALLEELQTNALDRVGPYGFGQGDFPMPVDVLEEDAMGDDDAMESEAAASDESATADAGEAQGGFDGSGESFSRTNNQEIDVDEADLVKTDGERLVVVSGNEVHVIDVTAANGDEPRLERTIRLPNDEGEFWGGELFLVGDTALLMSSGYTNEIFATESDGEWFIGGEAGRIVEINLATGEVGKTIEFEGQYLSAREVDGTIRIVVTASENRFDFVYPSTQGAEDAAEEANRRLIEDSTIDMWIPTYRITDDGQVVTDGPMVDCDRVHLPNQFAGFGSLVVMTVDVDQGLEVRDALSVFTDARTVYASTDRLAVSTPRWPEFDEDGDVQEVDDYRTAIHSFDITDPNETGYVASGTVRGHLLDQYSMSEYNGYLRVATTDGTPWDSRNSESFVTVLAEEGGELVQAGQVGGLGRGEQIFAVRFMGDIGYVVTFEQIDPLYTVDLSDPTNPVVRGELKIPGFSSYLFPWGDLLIGIGTDGDEQGRLDGAVASLFDVSDPDNPQLIDKIALAPEPGRGQGQGQEQGIDYWDSYSRVANDAKAFTAWQDQIIVPVTWYGAIEQDGFFEERQGSAAVLIQVDADAGAFIPVGRVGHPAMAECESGLVPSDGEVIVEGGDGNSGSTGAEGGFFPDREEETEPAPENDDAEAGFVTAPEPAPEEEPVEEEVPAPVEPGFDFCFRFQPDILRSVIVGDNLYTVSDQGVAVNRFDGLATVAWIPFG